jgi:hypothetical protein
METMFYHENTLSQMDEPDRAGTGGCDAGQRMCGP